MKKVLQQRRGRNSGRWRSACCKLGAASTQAAVEPPVPYLDTLRWVFIGVALVGIGVAV